MNDAKLYYTSSFLETYYVAANYVENSIGKSEVVDKYIELDGSASLPGLTEVLTLKFEEEYKDFKWGVDGDFIPETEKFFCKELE